MKRFIFRNPFVTKSDRALAKTYMEIAIADSELALRLSEDGDTKNAAKLTLSSVKMWHLAAQCLGFRNIADMDAYKKRHGHL